MDDQKETIKVSRKLYEKISQKVRSGETEFTTVDAFVEFVLSEILVDDQTGSAMTREDEELVSKRLKDLGY